MKEILEFLAARDLHLVIQTFCLEFSTKTLSELGFTQDMREERDELTRWRFEYCDFDDPERKSFTRLRVLRAVAPSRRSARKHPPKYESFIVGVDQDGEDMEHTCDPEQLRGAFGKNSNAASPLTPVSFRKDVLEKYRQEPSKYEITENTLRCGGLWLLPLDDDHDDKVVVWLGDLGENLPHGEQPYWRSFNFVSETRGLEPPRASIPPKVSRAVARESRKSWLGHPASA